MMKKLLALVALGGAAMVSGEASAAIVNVRLNLTAAGFAAGAPVNPVTGDFTFAFDNSASFDKTTTGLTINSFNLSGYDTGFSYYQPLDILVFGTDIDHGGCSASALAKDVCTFIDGISGTNPQAKFFYYSDGDDIYDATVTTTAVVPAMTAAVPEPATWATMMFGLGIAGATLRRRQRNTTRVRFA